MKNSELNEKTQNLFANRSDYDYRIDGNVLAIEDLGGYKSVTNDIENVIKDITDIEKINVSKFLIMYKDSMGIWDGIKVDHAARIEFFSINERIYSQAKGKLKHIS
jgi:hypothetical protein